MTLRIISRICIAALCAVAVILAASVVLDVTSARSATLDDGIVRVRSAYAMEETVTRLRADIAAKCIPFFAAIDRQSSPPSHLSSGSGCRLLIGHGEVDPGFAHDAYPRLHHRRSRHARSG